METRKCTFTGHRPQSLPFGFNESDERCVVLKRLLRKEVIRAIGQDGITHFISGMALGVDIFAAEIVLELKAQYKELSLECAIPCDSQAAKWNAKQRERYDNIISQCDIKTVLQHQYTPDCMQKRNQYMTDQADCIIAVWDGRPSGTGKTVRYALKQNKYIRVINPKALAVETYHQEGYT